MYPYSPSVSWACSRPKPLWPTRAVVARVAGQHLHHAAEVVENADCGFDVELAGLGDRLAHFQGFQCGDFVRVGADDLGGLTQVVAPLAGRALFPVQVRGVGGPYRLVHLLRPGSLDDGDRPAGGGLSTVNWSWSDADDQRVLVTCTFRRYARRCDHSQ